MAGKEKLTQRQQQVLDCIKESIKENGYPPSVREICAKVGLKSSSSVQSHLDALERKGYLKRNSSSARALTVESSKDADQGFSAEDAQVLEEVSRNTVPLPLVGKVAAGSPILAEQNIEEVIGLPKQLVGDANSFMLTVSGESMIEAGIFDGDIVVVTEQKSANNGEIVVAMIDGEATVKVFYKEDGRIRLQPANSTMEPIYADDVQILGKVKALIRQFR